MLDDSGISEFSEINLRYILHALNCRDSHFNLNHLEGTPTLALVDAKGKLGNTDSFNQRFDRNRVRYR